jgi:hypothetical protein
MQRSPLLAGTQTALVPGATQATPGQTCDVHPTAAHCAAIGSSSLVSFTQAGQPQVSDESIMCVHCWMFLLASHIRARVKAAL